MFFDYGGSGPVRLTGTEPIVGDFYAIEADGFAHLFINSMVTTLPGDWDDLCLAPGQSLRAGNKTITSITLTSGSGWAYSR